MLTRRFGLLFPRSDPAPEATAGLERDGYAALPAAFAPEEIAALRSDIERVFDAHPPDVRREDAPAGMWEDFRYEMLNRSAACQAAIGDRRILDVIEPLIGEDCHVIANTAWRNAPREADLHGGGHWHVDAGPHVPRPEGVPWPEAVPYPVFAVAAHIMLEDCPACCGPTAVIPRSHRSGRPPPFDRLLDDDLICDGEKSLTLEARAGDVLLFVSDVWHRRTPTSPGDFGRFFLQVHYGRRDLAQRLRPTSRAHQLSDDAVARATSERDRTLVGLHDPGFYDG